LPGSRVLGLPDNDTGWFTGLTIAINECWYIWSAYARKAAGGTYTLWPGASYSGD
jgi:hypothetical protein